MGIKPYALQDIFEASLYILDLYRALDITRSDQNRYMWFKMGRLELVKFQLSMLETTKSVFKLVTAICQWAPQAASQMLCLKLRVTVSDLAYIEW